MANTNTNTNTNNMYPALPDRYTQQQQRYSHTNQNTNSTTDYRTQQTSDDGIITSWNNSGAFVQQTTQRQQHYQQQERSNSNNSNNNKPQEVPGGPDGNQRYRATLFPLTDDHDVQLVICQLGIDGLLILRDTTTESSSSSSSSLNEIVQCSLSKLSSWQQIDETMFKIVCDDNKTVPMRELVITADSATTRAMGDSLLSGAFQWCELNGHDAATTIVCNERDGNEWTNDSSDYNVAKRRREISTEYALNNSTGAKAMMMGASGAETSSSNGVKYWEKPYEHSGWLYKKGETVRTWRRRWFILKDNHLFWFKSSDVTQRLQPRGTIPMNRVDSISPAAARDSGKNHSLTLEGAFCERIGARHLSADSDHERDGWITALRMSNSQVPAAIIRSPQQQQQPPSSVLSNQLKSAYAMQQQTSPSNFSTSYQPTSVLSPPPSKATTTTRSPSSYAQNVRSPPTISVATTSSLLADLPPLPFQHPGVVQQQQQQQQQHQYQHHHQQHQSGAPTPAAHQPSQVYYTPEGRAYIVDPLTGQSKWI